MGTLYTILLAALLPLMVLRLFWRSLQQRGYRENVGERFGYYRQPPLKNCIWIHAVSVGEARATEPLIRRLRILYPSRPILLTGMTPTGRTAASTLFANTLTCAYLPYDFVSFHKRLIDRFAPSILLVMETELWPNLLEACKQSAIPALVINARLSEKSRRGYSRVGAVRTLLKQSLQSVRVIAAQSIADAERFRALGAREVVVTGNIKFDVTIAPALLKLGESWRGGEGKHGVSKHVLLCASTRDGEEAMLLAAYVQTFDAEARANTLLVIVPRHPQRFDFVAEEIERVGLNFNRRSQSTGSFPLAPSAPVWLGDSMGEMAAYFAHCDVAIIGGSFLPLGGQNLIEACALGKPVIMGPSTFNFAEAAQLALHAGAMLSAAGATEAMQMAYRLLHDGARREVMSAAAFKLVDANRGATDTTIALIAPYLLS